MGNVAYVYRDRPRWRQAVGSFGVVVLAACGSPQSVEPEHVAPPAQAGETSVPAAPTTEAQEARPLVLEVLDGAATVEVPPTWSVGPKALWVSGPNGAARFSRRKASADGEDEVQRHLALEEAKSFGMMEVLHEDGGPKVVDAKGTPPDEPLVVSQLPPGGWLATSRGSDHLHCHGLRQTDGGEVLAVHARGPLEAEAVLRGICVSLRPKD